VAGFLPWRWLFFGKFESSELREAIQSSRGYLVQFAKSSSFEVELRRGPVVTQWNGEGGSLWWLGGVLPCFSMCSVSCVSVASRCYC